MTDNQHCDGLGPTTPESDDEIIDYFPTPHRELIRQAGKLARGEQARPEKVLGLQNGRTPRPG